MRHITIPIDAEEKTCGGCVYSSLSCSGESIGLTQCFNPAFEVGGEPPTTNGTRLPECLAAETRAGEVATLRADIERKDAAFEGHAKVSNELSKQAIRLADENAALRAEVARLTAEVERLMSQLKSAEEVVTQARQLVAYSWEDRLDDSRVSDDAKQDARELEIAVWHYDQRIKTKGTAT